MRNWLTFNVNELLAEVLIIPQNVREYYENNYARLLCLLRE